MPKLAAGTSSPTVQVSILNHCDGVRFTARYLLHFHLFQCDNQFWFRLVRAAIFILWHTRRVRMTELATPSPAPAVKTTIKCKCHSVSISTCYLNDLYVVQKFYQTWSGLVGIALDIGGEVFHRAQA